MKQIFLNSKAEISTTKNADTIYTGEMHFYKNPQENSFDDEIEGFNLEDCWTIDDFREMNRELAYKASIDPMNNGMSIIYFENIVPIA